MTTSAEYTLFPMQERSAAEDGPAFRTGRRTKWDAVIRTAQVDTSFDVVIQASGRGTADEDFREVHRETVSSTGVTKVGDEASTSFSGSQPKETELWIRAITENVDGDYAVEVVGRAPFFDPDNADHTDRLSKRTREWSASERDPLIEKAERTVLTRLGGMSQDGTLEDFNLLSAQAPHLIRRAIAAQVELEYKRDRAMKSDDPADAFLARGPRFPQIAEDAESALEPIIEDRGLHIVKHR